jgi:hypothetical protein
MTIRCSIIFSLIVLSVVGCTTVSPEQELSMEYSIIASPTPPRTLPELIAVLSSQDGIARASAAEALTSMGARAEPAVPVLIENLRHDNSDVRFAVARALGAIGPAADPAVSILIEMLRSGEYISDRSVAAEALGKIGDTTTVPVLAQALYDPDIGVGQTAAEALAELTGQVFPEYYTTDQGRFGVDTNGISWIVVKAREWWEQKGRHQEWSSR